MKKSTYRRLEWAGCAFVITRTAAWAGSLQSPGAPTDAASAMYRIEDIYNRLDTGAPGATQGYTDPAAGPTAATMHTLNELMAKASATERANRNNHANDGQT